MDRFEVQQAQRRSSVETALLATVDELSRELRPAHSGSSVSLDSSFDQDLGLDSLARVELLARVGERFGVDLPETSLASVETPRDLMRALTAAKLSARARIGPRYRSPLTRKPIEALPDRARTLTEVLAWHVERHPERPHIHLITEDGESIVNYSTLEHEAESTAAGLQKLGIEPAQSVALMLPTSREYFTSFFGVLLAGAIPVPIYPPLRPSQIEDHVRRHRGILANAHVVALITASDTTPVAQLLRAQVPTLRHVVTPAELQTSTQDFQPVTRGASDIAFLQYTSGSTGNPKGVVLTHANLLANIRVMGESAEVTSNDVFVSWLPLYHDMGLIGAWFSPLYYGIPLVVMPPLGFLTRPSRWLWALHRYRATLSASPNFGFELCLRRIDDRQIEGLDLSSVRILFNGAEAVSPATVERFSERFGRFGLRRDAMTPVYGLAENTLALTFPPLKRGPLIDRVRRDVFLATRQAPPAPDDDANALRFVSCGRPLAGHEVRIVDDAMRELPDRREGALQFRGPSATSSYFRNAEATSKLLVDGWLDSGDLAYMADGEVYVTGRRKDLIIHAGRHLYPEEIEETVGDLPGIRKGRVAVFGSADSVSGTERLVVLAETREADAGARAALTAQIRARVASLTGTAPDEVRLAPPQTILKTSSGKIRRAACRELYEQGAIGRAPRSATRQLLWLATRSILPELRRFFSRATEALYAAYTWSVFGLLAPIVWTLVMLLPRSGSRWRVLKGAAKLFARLCRIRITVHGQDNLPPPIEACIYVANHSSYIDGLALVAALPAPIHFVAKAEFEQSHLIGAFLRRIGAQFVERFDPTRGIEDARRLADVARRERLLFFPEGTFTRASGVLPFHLGAFATATQAALPIIPITLRGTRAILRADSWFPRRGQIAITIGRPIAPDAAGAACRDAWALAIRMRDAARREILKISREPDLAAAPLREATPFS
ncbi:MAG: AMP-binding protein [Sulfurifustis sp.]